MNLTELKKKLQPMDFTREALKSLRTPWFYHLKFYHWCTQLWAHSHSAPHGLNSERELVQPSYRFTLVWSGAGQQWPEEVVSHYPTVQLSLCEREYMREEWGESGWKNKEAINSFIVITMNPFRASWSCVLSMKSIDFWRVLLFPLNPNNSNFM